MAGFGNFEFVELRLGDKPQQRTFSGGFLFSENKHRGYNTYLRCIERDCPVRAKICGGYFSITSELPHNHMNNHEVTAEVAKAHGRLKMLARESSRPLRELHAEVLESVSLHLISCIFM